MWLVPQLRRSAERERFKRARRAADAYPDGRAISSSSSRACATRARRSRAGSRAVARAAAVAGRRRRGRRRRCCCAVLVVALARDAGRDADPACPASPRRRASARVGHVLLPQLARARAARDGVRRRLHRRPLAAARGRALHAASRGGARQGRAAARSRSSSARRRSRSRAGLRARQRARSTLASAGRHHRRRCWSSALLPHALPELIALFLPLAAWIVASRRGEWDELLAATFVTVAIAVPMLVVAAFVEVYVSPARDPPALRG